MNRLGSSVAVCRDCQMATGPNVSIYNLKLSVIKTPKLIRYDMQQHTIAHTLGRYSAS